MASDLGERLKGIFTRSVQLWLALGVGAVFVGMSFLDFYELIELKTFDYRMILRNSLFGPPEQMPNLATMDVDDQSVASLGRFEDWDRTYHARVIDIVGALGASEIGIDFLLLEESTPVVREDEVLASEVRSREDVLALFENPDHILAAANARWNNVFYAQYLVETLDGTYDEIQATKDPLTEEELRFIELEEPYTVPMTQEHHKDVYVGTELWAPVDTILTAARGAGQVQPIPDMDGIVRRTRALYAYEGRLYPALALVMACDYLSVPIENMRVERKQIVLPSARVPGESQARDVVIPMSERGEILINWAGDYRSTYRHYPYAAILGFWESYQRDRLAAAVKRELIEDPELLMNILSGLTDLNDLTTGLLLDQARFPRVDVLGATQEVAVALRLAPLARDGVPVDEAIEQVIGIPAAQLWQPDRWRALYGDLRVNHGLAAQFASNPQVTIGDAAAALGTTIDAISTPYSRIRLLSSPTDGTIPAQQYPLWFFVRTLDGTPVASRDILNARLATSMKQYFRTHGDQLDAAITTIASQDPEAYAFLSDVAIDLIADAASFPQQAYGSNVFQIVEAALLEPLIADGMGFEDMILNNFGVMPEDLPEDVVADYLSVYETLLHNLDMESIVNAMPDIGIRKMADSLTTLDAARLMAANPDIDEASAREQAVVRPTDIASDFYTLLHFVEEEGVIPPEAHPLVFYTIVVDGKPVFASDFRNTVMFYGITSTGGHDRNPTPFEPRYPMVGMHVNMFNQIITNQFLHRPSQWVNWLILLALAAVMGVAVPRFSPTAGGGIMVVMLGGYVATAVLLFAKTGLWIDVYGPISVVVFSYLGITVRNYIVEEKEKKFIKGAFANYLAPEVVAQIADNPEGLKLGGDNFEITAFFSDVKGFSSISQALTATQLVDLLNDYLTEMCNIIIDHQGTVDKFEGDAIIAFFGAPIAFNDHAIRACLSTIAMQETLDQLRPKYKEQWGQELFHRIGLNSDVCVVGNMGSRTRFDYTMMGDGVNLAARLESSAKQFGIYSQISESTYEPAKDHVEVRELDRTIVVGRDEPVTVYELLARKGELNPVMTSIRDRYEDGLAYYREQKWEQAIVRFRMAMEADAENGDETSEMMIERIESIQKGEIEIAADWDGVWALTEK